MRLFLQKAFQHYHHYSALTFQAPIIKNWIIWPFWL